MNSEKQSLLEEELKEEENSLIDEESVDYQQGVDETKQLYWLNKYIVKELRKKDISNADARRYANRHAYRILQKAKANSELTVSERKFGVLAHVAGI